MELAAKKWGGGPHYRGEVHVLGDDEHGMWLWGIQGRPIWVGEEVVFHRQLPVVMVLPPGAWWYATWWLGHDDVDVYVNINTPVVHDGDVLAYVDLDLDVVRRRDGSVEIVDRDELEVHSVQLGYPDEIVAAAETAADEVFGSLRRNDPPFDGVARAAWVGLAEERFGSDV